MSEPPIIKVKKDYSDPPNITAEVPGEQTIREVAPQSDTPTTSIQVTEEEFTLSPVITVTKKETTLSKGDIKLQKVTVTEDIALQDMENGQEITYSGSQMTIQTSKQTISRTIMPNDVTEGGTDKQQEKKREEKRSRIPQLKFRQTVERVKKERREQKADQAENKPRRSSIPKLKDAKLVKRQASLNYEPKTEDLTEAEAKIIDEFDKIYEEIADISPKDIDDKILAVKIDDPEKVETKFEEIIHAYDSNDDNYLTPTEKLRLSKIPWRRKDDGSPRASSASKSNNSAADMRLKDGGFKVSGTTIKTKRFARGNSADLSSTQKVDIVELNDPTNGQDKEVIKETVVTETVEGTPVTTKFISRGVKRGISLDSDDIKVIRKVDQTKDNIEEIIEVEEIDGGQITREITRQHFKTGIPVKPERINRSISKELNRRPATLDDRDFVNREVVKHETFNNGSSKTVITETVVKEIPVKTEKVSRGISRTFSRDGKSVTVSPKLKEINKEAINIVKEDSTTQDINKDVSTAVEAIKDIQNDKPDIKKEVLKPEKNVKESPKKGIPVLAKTTHTYSKGHIQNVEISRTIEWKSADEVKTKKYVRSYSENKKEVNDKKFAPTVIKKEIVIDAKLSQENASNSKEYKHIPRDDNSDKNAVEIIDNSRETADALKDVNNVIPKTEINVNEIINNVPDATDKPEITQELPISKEPEDSKVPEKNKDSDISNVTILKGNVRRLIGQISVKDESDVSKKDIDVEEELPKKKSILSKIAMFEGKEPAEFNIKIKKCTVDKIAPLSVSKETVNDEPKIVQQVLKPQFKKPKDDINDIEVSVTDEETREYNNQPVIVDQIWKVQEQNVENGSAIQIEDVKILPAAIESTVSENTFETAQILPGKIEFDVNVTQSEATTTLPVKIDLDISQNQVEPITVLPGKVNFVQNDKEIEVHYASEKISGTEIVVTNPEKIGFSSNDVKDKYSSDKIENNKQNEMDIKKPKVGKLNLNFWQKRVEDNKKPIGTGKINKDQTHIESQKILPGAIAFETSPNQVEIPKILPGKIEKREDSTEMPAILPGKIYLQRDVSQNDTIKTEIVSKDKQLQVPVILPETPLTKPNKMDFETQQSQIDIPINLPNKIEHTPNIQKVESSTTLPGVIKVKIDKNASENGQILPVQLDLTTKETQNDPPKILPGKIEFNTRDYRDKRPKLTPGKINNDTDEAQYETPRILPSHIDFKVSDNKVEITKPLPGRLDLSLYESFNKPKELNVNSDTRDKSTTNTEQDGTDDVDKEIASDPELVDSEPEIKETIMSKLKNKIYFIANKRNKTGPQETPVSTNEAPTSVAEIPTSIEDIPTPTAETPISIADTPVSVENNENEHCINENKLQNNDSDVSTTEYVIENNTIVRKQEILDENESKEREDLKRAKSLAELDLGDVVKGQVQRMVYRIKSVDFEKMETSRVRKISVKEMPRKSSVLEKIALFEGKAASTKWSKTEKPHKVEITTTRLETTPYFETRTTRLEDSTVRSETTTAPPNVTQGYVNDTRPTPEEIYLQKVEDLSTAKVRYGKLEMLYLQLGNGEQMPAIALGTALMDNRLTSNIVAAAIDLGFRAIDTAYIYGNEKEVGEGIRKKINDNTVTRKDLFIMSKLWSTFHHPQLVETACRASLEALGLDYFDLYMIHNPMSFKEGGDPIPKIASVLQFSEYDYLDAWFAMEGLVRKGLVKNIGVSNFNSQQIQRILEKGKIRPVVNQVECHPYLSQQRLQNFCMERNITLSCFGVLGSKGTPIAYKNTTEAVIDDPLVKVMASGLNLTTAQLLVRYQIQSGRNVVVKASTAAHLWDVLQALTFTLEQHQIDALHALNQNRRTFTFKGMGDTHKNYPFREPF